jgi:hypothetical protein
MLTPEQIEVAKALLLVRPDVVLGTRAIINPHFAAAWHDIVRYQLQKLKIGRADDRTAFCDVAGVAD